MVWSLGGNVSYRNGPRRQVGKTDALLPLILSQSLSLDLGPAHQPRDLEARAGLVTWGVKGAGEEVVFVRARQRGNFQGRVVAAWSPEKVNEGSESG